MNRPRRPTYYEMADFLTYFLSQDNDNNWEDISATDRVDFDLVAVFDSYYCPFPYYSGRIMVRISGLQDYDFNIYVWKDGKIMPLEEYKALQDKADKPIRKETI